MAMKHLCLLLLTVVGCTIAQSEDELHIPYEADNHFPPDNHSDSDGGLIEGSGVGALEEPVDVTTLSTPPILEDIQSRTLIDDTDTPSVDVTSEELSCPKPCMCHVEGDSDDFTIDCSGYGLTEFPTPLNSKTTTLNVQNNKLTEIPKEVAQLKNLKVLNANKNSIMDLASGSVSELSELKVLKLGDNRLLEFPKDLKNGFSLTKLEELDLGGNDMRTPFSAEMFSNFKSLRQLTLPTSTPALLNDLCSSLKTSLETVCTESCDKPFDCQNIGGSLEDDLSLDIILPATIALFSASEDNSDPALTPIINKDLPKVNNVTTEEKINTGSNETAPSSNEAANFSLRSVVNKAPEDVSPLNKMVETPKDVSNNTGVEIGATTSSTTTGGVDKSVIGMIVAGMVVIVAGVTIKKNWSSIKKRFSSTPRPPNDRNQGPNANGTTPEEVPLQEKSPV